MNDADQTALRAYGDLFETLSADTLERLDDLVHQDVLFRDPFHEGQGTRCHETDHGRHVSRL